jgi:cytochrome c-type biogenesis protein CcmH
MGRLFSAFCGLLLILGVTLAGAQTFPEESAKEPAAAGLARDLIGEPEGGRLSGAELDRVTEEVASLMRCPVCQGLSVADSPTTSALAMREEARDLLALGYTEDQVLSYFERSYGEFIRLSPRPEGFNLVVWILPFAALLVGALVITGRIRRRARLAVEAAKAETEAPGVESPEEVVALASYAERVRREVSE